MILELTGTLNNFGTVTIDSGATFAIDFGAVVNNAGSFVNHGATFNYGTVSNSAILANGAALFDNEATGIINNDNNGKITNDFGGSFINVAGGVINNNAGSDLDNSFGVFTNDAGGIISNAAFIDNFGPFHNVGTINNNLGGLVVNEGFGGLFDNTAGSIADSGTIENICSGNFVVGTISGNPVQFHPCSPLISTLGNVFTRTPTIFGTSNLLSGGGVGSTTPMSIKLYEGVTQIGSAVTDSSGNWNIVTPSLASGPHTFTATATDAGSFTSPHSNPSTITVVLTTSLLASCTPTPFPVGTGTLCTATVTEQAGTPSTAPTGPVTLTASKSGSPSGPCALSPTGTAGASQCQDTFTPAGGTEGAITITMTYPGDIGHSGTSSTFSVDATTLGTTTSLSCPAFIVNTVGSCFATVTDSPSSANVPPTGTVTFIHSSLGAFTPGSGMCTLGGVPLNSRSCFVGYTPALASEGTVTIAAFYGGDSDHQSSSVTGFVFSVSYRSDGTVVSCSPNPDAVNGPASCTATVTDTSPPTMVTPSGTVTFSSSGSGTFSPTFCTLVAGTCSVTYTPHPGSEGTHTVTAIYNGDTDHFTSSGSFGLTVIKRSTSAALSCTGPLDVGSPETCTITVKDNISPGTALTPTGKVTFKMHPTSGLTITRTCTLVAGVLGTASCHVTFTPNEPPRSWTVMGAYPGDVNHLGASTSVILVISD